MNKLLSLLSLLLLLVAGCSNSGSTVGPGTNPTGGSQIWRGVTASVGGSPWSAETFDATNQSSYTTISASASGSEIGITFPSVSAPTTLQFRSAGATAIYSNGVNIYSTDGNNNAGTLTISEVDATHIAGSFSFTAAETQSSELLRVTSGKFNVVF
jgi:hypothetical protein